MEKTSAYPDNAQVRPGVVLAEMSLVGLFARQRLVWFCRVDKPVAGLSGFARPEGPSDPSRAREGPESSFPTRESRGGASV